jgi:FdhD protein
MASSIYQIKTVQFKSGKMIPVDDLVVVEEPLEIRLGFGELSDRKEQSVVITMRTPGNDFELAAGFLFCEGILSSKKEIASIKYCYSGGKEQQEEDNVVRVELKPDVLVDLKNSERHGFSHSGCGICGLTSIESAFKLSSDKVCNIDFKIDVEVINSLSEKAQVLQHNFKYTGGIHSASLFSEKGELLGIMEDVGRHNALDKIIGKNILEEKEIKDNTILFLSGRMGFELVQKAAMAGICVLVSVGAPSSLAIQLGMKMKMTLIGFTKKDKFNVYCGSERLNYS